MNAREAEKLLGGYATGTLSEAERRDLFAAALEDQALFDALADEELLRELLADPAARARLLAALEPKPKAVPFWRRPVAMSLAASLLIAVGVGLLLKHGPRPVTALPSEELAAPIPQVKAAPKVLAAPLTPQEPKRARRAPAVEAEPAPPHAKAPAAPAQAPAPQPSEVSGAASTVEVVADQAQGGAPAPMAKKAERAPEALAYLTPGVASVPTWTWGADGHNLSIAWGPSGFLYLIERDAAGAKLLAPRSTDTFGGRKRSVYQIEGDGALDLYWMNEAVPDPLKLPAEGSITGFHAHLPRPEKKRP